MELHHYANLFGLIGYPLSHSFSKRYFSEKFKKEGIEGCFYELFPIATIEELPALTGSFANLQGLNVTIPYKEAVFPFLDEIDDEAKAVGAVNTIRIRDGKLKGFNTDVYGFEISLKKSLEASLLDPFPLPPESFPPPIPDSSHSPAPSSPLTPPSLILGTGGAAKAVAYVLGKLGIDYLSVSRSAGKGDITYADIDEKLLSTHRLIVNTTPLGMAPKVETCPELPYAALTNQHVLYDLVYNPEMTSFLKKGKAKGAIVQNGLEMLYLQAEKAWEIWNE